MQQPQILEVVDVYAERAIASLPLTLETAKNDAVELGSHDGECPHWAILAQSTTDLWGPRILENGEGIELGLSDGNSGT